MVTLDTVKRGSGRAYVRVDTDLNGKEVSRTEVSYRVLPVKLADGSVGFVLLDSDGNSVPYFHRFINTRLLQNGSGMSTRRAYAGIIKRFYSFMSLMGYSVYTLGTNELYQLRAFLQGTGPTQCSNETVNTCLSVIRSFYKANGIPNEGLFAQHEVVGTHPGIAEFRVSNVYRAYDINLRTNPHRNERVPKYISMEQYVELIKAAREAGDWNAIILMHLMFRYGLRLGECLGLTEEDMVTLPVKGQDVPVLILRNRLSDNNDQRAKRRINPTCAEDYEGVDYIKQWKDDDYSHIYLTESTDFVLMFETFVRNTREHHERVNSRNYRSCEADIVCPKDFKSKGLKKNHYIFVNHLGKRLSAQYWGKRLKAYFMKVGISIDVDRRCNNLSHRCRHGFAMMHARFMDPPVPATELQKMMRHKCLSSTMVYYNPTPEDEYEYKTKMQNRFYDCNPVLNNILTEFINTEVHYED